MLKKTITLLGVCHFAMANPISVHVLNLDTGTPAKNINVSLDKMTPSGWRQLNHGSTDQNGRINNLFPSKDKFESGIYMVSFQIESYFRQKQQKTFFPTVDIPFKVESTGEHYHIPLLLNKFGYSTYRGN